jgi:hypothetical protein
MVRLRTEITEFVRLFVIRDAGINIRETIFHKPVQVLAFGDDMHIIGRTQKSMKETFVNLERSAKRCICKLIKMKQSTCH